MTTTSGVSGSDRASGTDSGVVVVTVHPVFVDTDKRGCYEAAVPVDGPLPVTKLLARLQRDHPVRITDSKGTLLAGRGVVVDGRLLSETDVMVSPTVTVDVELVPSFVGG